MSKPKKSRLHTASPVKKVSRVRSRARHSIFLVCSPSSSLLPSLLLHTKMNAAAYAAAVANARAADARAAASHAAVAALMAREPQPQTTTLKWRVAKELLASGVQTAASPEYKLLDGTQCHLIWKCGRYDRRVMWESLIFESLARITGQKYSCSVWLECSPIFTPIKRQGETAR